MNIRKITSMTMLLSFILLVLTSIILYIVPHGRVAYWSDWHLWGLTKTQWGNLHINLGFLFLFSGIVHIFYNWKLLLAYMKNRTKKLTIFTPSFNIALLTVLVVSIGTLYTIPPMSTVIDLGESIKDASSKRYGEPPYGHAELSSLKLYAKRTDLDLSSATQLLKQAGIQLEGSQQTLLEIARNNSLAPKEVAHIMEPARQKERGVISFPDSPPPGFGILLLSEICEKYHLNEEELIKKLNQQGITAKGDQKFKGIAALNQLDPHELFAIIHQLINP